MTRASTPEGVELPPSIWRTVEDVVTLDQLRERAQSSKPMRMKYGVDLTAPDLHIGHAVNLWLYRAIQELGHKLVFLLGDFTTRIGDPTGKSKTRPVIPPEEVERNARMFLDQATQVVLTNPDVFEIRRNSEWSDPMSAAELLRLMSGVTLERLTSREMFRRRITAGEEIYAHELVYPLLQGWDSVALGADLTVIGTDQLFNEMVGRWLQERQGQPPQVIITTRITPGIDGGEKQSKSLGNYVGLTHSPRDKFGRLMRIPDLLIGDYFEVYTALAPERVAEYVQAAAADPFDAKLSLAREVVARYHGKEIADRERAWFVSTFSERRVPDDIPVMPIESPSTVIELIQRLLPGRSNSELRRLVAQGGVRIDSKRPTAFDELIDIHEDGVVVRAGRRNWARFVRAGARAQSPGHSEASA